MIDEEKKAKLQLHLEDCQTKFNALKKLNYVPPVTQGEELAVGETMEPSSEEYEFDDAYTDPVEAIKLFVEILQTKTELGGGTRSKIVSTETAMEIMGRPVTSREFPLLPNGIISKLPSISHHQRDLIVHTNLEKEVVVQVV